MGHPYLIHVSQVLPRAELLEPLVLECSMEMVMREIRTFAAGWVASVILSIVRCEPHAGEEESFTLAVAITTFIEIAQKVEPSDFEILFFCKDFCFLT